MRRLLYAISFTHDLDETKRFYRDGIGLAINADTPFMVNFAADGAGLVLLAVQPSHRREVELCFEAVDAARAVEELRSRGVHFADELRQLSFGSVIHFRDPEDNLLSLLQPGTADEEPAPTRRGKALAAAQAGRLNMQTALALEESERQIVSAPRLTSTIVNCRDLSGMRGYYRDWIGLHMSMDYPHWMQFETGDVRLALHSRSDRSTPEQDLAQPVAFGVTVEDLNAWAEAAEARGVKLANGPVDSGFGMAAEVLDPEGNLVVIREAISEEALEERLAEGYDGDAEPHRTSMRKPLNKAARAASRVAIKPDYKPKKQSAKSPSTGGKLRVASPRGTGPAGTRAKPKSLKDPKRAKARPAIGRAKKAEARSKTTKKQVTASASKSRPVKKAAKPRTKGKRR